MDGMMQRVLRNILLISLPTLLLCLIVVEIVFRIAVPASEMPAAAFDERYGVLRYDPEVRREGTYTMGAWARHRSRWRINDAGWNSAVEYVPAVGGERPGTERPLVALIGDSFIEGFQVDVTANVAARLRHRLSPDYDVYGFGISGAPLSHYLQMSRYVNREFDPDVVLVNVVHNDFLESVRDFVPRRHVLQLARDDASFREVAPVAYRPVEWRRALQASAIVRFCTFNAQVLPRLQRALQGGKKTYVANVDLDEVEARRVLIGEATRFIVRALREENADRRLLFTMIQPRKGFDEASTRDVRWMHELIADACRESGCEFLDLTEAFRERRERDGAEFQFAEDSHWNELGHETAAIAMAELIRAAPPVQAQSDSAGAQLR